MCIATRPEKKGGWKRVQKRWVEEECAGWTKCAFAERAAVISGTRKVSGGLVMWIMMAICQAILLSHRITFSTWVESDPAKQTEKGREAR